MKPTEQNRPTPADDERSEHPDDRRDGRKPRRRPREIGGPEGPEPTRYGDWERNGRCTDF